MLEGFIIFQAVALVGLIAGKVRALLADLVVVAQVEILVLPILVVVVVVPIPMPLLVIHLQAEMEAQVLLSSAMLVPQLLRVEQLLKAEVILTIHSRVAVPLASLLFRFNLQQQPKHFVSTQQPHH